MRLRHRNITNEGIDCDAVVPIVVGCKQASGDIRLHFVSAHRHSDRGASKRVGAANGCGSKDGCAASCDSPRNIRRRERGSVEQHDSFQPFGSFQHRGESDGSAPIVCDECDSIEVEVVDQCDEVVAVRSERVWKRVLCGFVAAPASDMVDSDNAMRGRESLDDAAIIKAPRRIAVNTEQRFAGAVARIVVV